MKNQSILKNQGGFTLVEIIAVLIILGILAAVAVPRYIDLESSAKQRAIDAAVSELNGRESLAWADVKITYTGTGTWEPTVETLVWNRIIASGVDRPNLGPDYAWSAAPSRGSGGPTGTAGGATVIFRGTTVPLSRFTSTQTQPGSWRR